MRRFDDRHILLFYKGPKVYSSHVDARESDHPATRQRQSGSGIVQRIDRKEAIKILIWVVRAGHKQSLDVCIIL
uniref:Uncharacterized protein n=1 Tax=Oryza glumipatula TaxID=40148 RepID=A0A0E0AL79_9ORYZ